MPRVKRLAPAADWQELIATPADWKAADPALLAAMLGQLHLIRAFEETVLELAAEGLVHGPAHSSIGQEGGAVGSIVSLRSSDAVNGSHRGHHQFLAKALTHVTKGQLDLDDLATPAVAEVLRRTLAEILGLAQGYCGGRGGSMHLQWLEAGALGTNAIVGGGVPMAAGNSWAQKRSPAPEGSDLTVTYFGDGAVNIGSVLETLNLASAWKLPLCFFMENNGYAVSTTVAEATGEPRLSARALGFGITAWRVDGMDPLAVHLAMERAAARLRAGEGPVVIEALVYRFFHQNGPYPGSAFGYRTREEEAEWRARDPLDRIAREMTGLGLIDEAGVAAVRAQAVAAMRAAADALTEPDPSHGPSQGAKPGARRIRPELWPDPAFVDVGIRGDRSELAGARTPASSYSVRTCTSWAAAPTAPPRAWRRSTRGASSAPRSARTRSPGSAAGSRSTGGSARWSSSCTRTSCGSPPTRCSTRSARPGTCSAAGTRCRSCCARRSPWGPATARST